MRPATRRATAAAASYALLCIAAFAALFPLFWTLSTAVKTREDTFALPPVFVGFTPTLKNFAAILQTRGFGQIFLNTVVITAASTLLCVAVSTLAAYALARAPRFRGRRPLEIGMILIRAIPAIDGLIAGPGCDQVVAAAPEHDVVGVVVTLDDLVVAFPTIERIGSS